MTGPLPAALFLLLELVVVSWFDLKTRKISNLWPLANMGLFLLLIWGLPESYALSWTTFQYPIILLIIGYGLFLLNIMGAGDAKYIPSCFLLLPPSLHEDALVFLGYSTVLVGLPLLLVNSVKNFDKIVLACKLQDKSFVKGVFGKKFPYAPVVLVSYLWMNATIFWELLPGNRP